MPRIPQTRLRIDALEERSVPAAWTDPTFAFSDPATDQFALGTPSEPSGEHIPPTLPVDVVGEWLTSPIGVQPDIAYDDPFQGRLDSCVIVSSTSAIVSATPGTILIEIPPQGFVGPKTTENYRVRMFKPNASTGVIEPTWVTVPFDGSVTPEDMRPADNGEFWTILVQRAYLQLAQDLGFNYRQINNAYRSLIGVVPTQYDPAPNSRADAQAILNALNAGKPVTAATVGSADDPVVILNAQYGIVGAHAYTVMGIELPPSGTEGIWVTLRNPWGRDNHWKAYDLDASGDLDLGEWFEYKGGIDGRNDGEIRVPWSVFATHFKTVAVGPALASGSINKPQKPEGQVQFANPNPGPFTIREGEVLTISVPATDPEGSSPFYQIDEGPGYVQVQTGAYTWTPGPDDLGLRSVTISASTNGFDSNSVTFLVNVTSGRPRIQSLSASTGTVTDAGTDPLVLTANGVVHDFDDVDFVEFYRDANGNNTLDPATDFLLKKDVDIADGWNWNGQLTGVSPGSYRLFARAGRYSFSDLFYSNVVGTSITVTAAPPVEEVAVKVGGETTVVTDNAGARPVQVTKDAAGNTYVFSNRGGAARMIRYNAAGTQIGGEATLVGANVVDVAMQPSGAFVVIWEESGTLYARRHNPDGTTPTGAVLQVSDPGVIGGSGGSTGYGRVAINANGTFIVAWVQGSYFGESLYFRRFQGDNPLSASSHLDGGSSRAAAPGVAIDSVGNTLIGWSSYNYDRVVVRRVDAGGTYDGQFYPSAFGNKPSGDTGSVHVGWLPDGGFVTLWSDGSEVHVRRANTDGEFLTANPVRVNAVTTGTQEYPRLAVTPNGHSVVLWQSQGQDPGDGTFDWGVYGQVFGNDGRAMGSNFRVPTTTTSSQFLRGVASDDGLDFNVVWGQLDPNIGAFGTITSVRTQRYAVELAPVVSTRPVEAVGRQAKRTANVPAGDPDGQPVTVTAVNGIAITAGGSVDLPSGARVTRNANGTLGYEPRNAIAVGSIDSFVYTVSDGSKSSFGSMSFRIAPDLTATPVLPSSSGLPEVRFSELPANRATSLQVTLKGVGADEILGTADDTAPSVTPTWNDTTLVLPGLSSGLYRVTIDDALADETGRLLDGDGNGTPGGDYVRDFVVSTPGAGTDGSFGTGGVAFSNLGDSESEVRAMVVQPDGKILVAGFSNHNSTYFDFAIARYLPNGTLDPTFGTGGVVQTDFGVNRLDRVRALALQADGKIVAVGEAAMVNQSDHSFAVARYLTDGTLDTTFDVDGLATDDFGQYRDQADGVVVLPDGKIVVSGRAGTSSNNADFALLRLLPDGTPDSTFDGDGRVVTPTDVIDTDSATYQGRDFRRLTDGRLVVSHVYNNTLTIARYLPNGGLDPAFGTGGIHETQIPNFTAFGLSIQNDGHILVPGVSYRANEPYAAVVRYLPNGTLDESFGTGGLALAMDSSNGSLRTALTQPDGSILAAGQQSFQTTLIKFRPDGTSDSSFGTAGSLQLVDFNQGEGYAMAVGPDGRVLVAGSGYNGSYREFAVWRATSGGAVPLAGAGGFTFNVDPAGVGAGQVGGPGFESLNALRVNTTDFTAPLAANGAADGGRTLLTGIQTLDQLAVYREVTVPDGSGVSFARNVDAFSNSIGLPVSTTVRYVSNLGSDAATVVFATSDGDTIPEATDWWIGTDDANGSGSPAVIHVLGGPRGLKPTSVQLTGDSLVWSYNLTVDDGETTRLASFVIPATTRSQALAALNSVIARTGFVGDGGAYLTLPELASLENVVFLQAPTAAGPLNPVSGTEDVALPAIPLRPVFADVEDGSAGLSYSVVAIDGVYNLVEGSVDPATDILTLAPNRNANGTATITVRATDSDGLTFDRSFDVTLDPVADAPLTDIQKLLMLPSVARNALSPPGVSVATLLRNSSNPDGSASAYGIAVTGLGGLTGRWESTTAVGGLWTQIVGVSDANALLLPRTAYVRFIPGRNLSGHAGIQFRAWDGTTMVTNIASAPAAFSANEVGWAPVGIVSPVFDTIGQAKSASMAEDVAGKAVYAKTLLGLLAGEFAAGTSLGLAVTGTTGSGTWQVRVGATWQPFGTVSETAARLLKPLDLVRFVPDANWNGEATFEYRAWQVPAVLPLPTIGNVLTNPSGFSVETLSAAATVLPVNDAPILGTDTALFFGSEPIDVVTLMQNASDIDNGISGIAVTRRAFKNGTWEYRLSAASGVWTPFPAVTTASALLLGPTAEIRFVPKAGTTVGGGSFDFKVVDESITFVSGSRRTTAGTAFSKVVETGTAAFGNTLPTFKTGPAPVLTSYVRGRTGMIVSGLLTRMSDTVGFLKGLAVTATSGSGTWDYSVDGGRTWRSMALASNQRVLLRSTDRVRFTPALGFTGPATLTYAAWDRTLGVAGDRTTGGDDSQSLQLLTAAITIV
jgi:uncharacterized delta-60 repeat protein